MRLNLLSYASGLGLIAGALLWPTPSRAQGFCYMVDADGTVTNLDSLCQGNNTPNPIEPQADTAGAAQQSSSQNVRNFTIVGPPSIPGSSQASPGGIPTTPQPTPTPGITPTTPQLPPNPGVVPTTPQPVPSSQVAPNAPQIVPPLQVAPNPPQIVPTPGVAPVAPRIVPSSGVSPSAPQPTGAGVAPAGSAVGVDGAGNDTGIATPAAEIRVPGIVVPGIPVPGIGAPSNP
jgi:hypothetical protein